MTWLTDELKSEIKEVFEPKYDRSLSDQETLEIAENLTGAIEEILTFKWRKYEKITG